MLALMSGMICPLESHSKSPCRTRSPLAGRPRAAKHARGADAWLGVVCVSRYDATSHFETTVEDVLELYTRITGKVLDLSSKDPSKAQQ